jgi:hypothetical protein
MSGRRFAALTALVLAQTLSGTPAGATEGGASLYIPGLLGPGAGIVPPPGFYFSNVAYSYWAGVESRSAASWRRSRRGATT